MTATPVEAPVGAPVGAPVEPSAAVERHYTLVTLHTGPRQEPLSEAESAKIFGGHFGNMQRLAREGQLLVAGPYGKVKSDPTLRGIFVLDTADPERARQLAETDPGFKAGVFALQYQVLATAAPLRKCLALEMARQDEVARSGHTVTPGEGVRSYVLLTADDGAAAAAVLVGHAATLWFSRLDSTHALVLLDVADAAAAAAILAPLAPALGAYHLDEWYSSRGLADLAKIVP